MAESKKVESRIASVVNFRSEICAWTAAMSSHQANQANASAGQTYQYQWGEQILEIPSNTINYQLENVITSGGVSRSVYI